MRAHTLPLLSLARSLYPSLPLSDSALSFYLHLLLSPCDSAASATLDYCSPLLTLTQDPKDAALRELREEAHLEGSSPQLVSVYGAPGRYARTSVCMYVCAHSCVCVWGIRALSV